MAEESSAPQGGGSSTSSQVPAKAAVNSAPLNAAPVGSAAQSAAPATPTPTPKGPTIRIGEEFGTAKKNLPPAKVVIPAIVAVVIIVAIVVFFTAGKTQGSGTLDNVVAAEIPGQTSTMVALTFTLKNTTDKILYVRSVQGKLKTANEESSAEAVSAVDFDRYFQAFPALKNGAHEALPPETKIQPGETVTLKPSSLHVMLLNLKHPLEPGKTVEATLKFEKAGTAEIGFPILGIGAPAPGVTSGGGGSMMMDSSHGGMMQMEKH